MFIDSSTALSNDSQRRSSDLFIASELPDNMFPDNVVFFINVHTGSVRHPATGEIFLLEANIKLSLQTPFAHDPMGTTNRKYA